MHAVAHSVKTHRHQVVFDQLGFLVTHIIDPYTGNPIGFLVHKLIVHIQIPLDKLIRPRRFLKHPIHKLPILRNLKQQFHPNRMRQFQFQVGLLTDFIRVVAHRHVGQQFCLSVVNVLMETHCHCHVAYLCYLGLQGLVLGLHFFVF